MTEPLTLDTFVADAGLDDWFARRTYPADELDEDALAAHKDGQGLTVSVVLPAHNEEETIAAGVCAAKRLLTTLVDQIVVIDDRSTDDTARLASAAGAEVHASSRLLPAFGSSQGKGDVLWRSLSVTSGDIVVFVDADIRNPSPRFISRLLAPLLTAAGVHLVKAFYDRPVLEEGALGDGGGRVTELLARPLLNLLWPSLAHLVQPLSGEYAARRDLLESLPFFTGYGVELGMLIDTLDVAGLDAIAQADVGERVHHNQPLDALSRMAFAIAQVAMRRAGLSEREAVPGTLDTYVQFARDDQQRVMPRTQPVPVTERPPLASLVTGRNV